MATLMWRWVRSIFIEILYKLRSFSVMHGYFTLCLKSIKVPILDVLEASKTYENIYNTCVCYILNMRVEDTPLADCHFLFSPIGGVLLVLSFLYCSQFIAIYILLYLSVCVLTHTLWACLCVCRVEWQQNCTHKLYNKKRRRATVARRQRGGSNTPGVTFTFALNKVV